MNQEIEPILMSHQEEERSLSPIYFGIGYNAIWAILFLAFRIFNDESCPSIEIWTLLITIQLFITAAYKLCVELHLSKQSPYWNQYQPYIDALETIIFLLLLIGLTVALFNEETCSLRSFALVYTIISYLIILIAGTTLVIAKFSNDNI